MTDKTNSKEGYTLITGASKGIGKAFAVECAKQKRNLVLVSLPGTGLEETSRELEEKFGVRVLPIVMDLTLADAPQRIYQYTKENNIRINFLINNAGVGYDGKFENHTIDQIDTMILLNIRALTAITQIYIPDLKSFDRSHVLNVSSFGSYLPTPFKSVYLASKSYVYYFSEALRSELQGTPVKVHTVLPGPVMTNGHTRKRIEKAGYFARIITMDASELATFTLKKISRGRSIIIPGRVTRSMFLVINLFPMILVRFFLRNYFRGKSVG